MVWFGSATNFVDLNPGPEWGSQAFGTNGLQQAGVAARTDGPNHAALWSGTPESFLDLHQFLPPEYQGQGEYSWASGIDAEGNIIGFADDLTLGGRPRAVLWRVVPEPATGLVVAAGLVVLLSRRRRR
ncbi:MAG: PEP-CTERM sorting domain-containing protein [Armatimonadetes bacterium]|nr:PEP-CTERM sorting domain-containing protein [Armatimonadota bacterium]